MTLNSMQVWDFCFTDIIVLQMLILHFQIGEDTIPLGCKLM